MVGNCLPPSQILGKMRQTHYLMFHRIRGPVLQSPRPVQEAGRREGRSPGETAESLTESEEREVARGAAQQ